MPDMLRRPDHERVRVEFLGGRGEFPGRAAPPGADVYLYIAGPGDLVQLGQQPPLQCLGVTGHPHDLADSGKVWLNVDRAQLGLGSAACGPALPGQYRLPREAATWSVLFTV